MKPISFKFLMIFCVLKYSDSLTHETTNGRINHNEDISFQNEEQLSPPIYNATRKENKYNKENYSVLEVRLHALREELGEGGHKETGLMCVHCSNYRRLTKLCHKKFKHCEGCSSPRRREQICKLQFAVDILDKKIAFLDLL